MTASESVRTYRAGARAGAVDAWRELWQGRDIVRAFAVRSLRLRYRQTLLGVVWAVVQPLALLVPIALFLSDDTPTIGCPNVTRRGILAALTLLLPLCRRA